MVRELGGKEAMKDDLFIKAVAKMILITILRIKVRDNTIGACDCLHHRCYARPLSVIERRLQFGYIHQIDVIVSVKVVTCTSGR